VLALAIHLACEVDILQANNGKGAYLFTFSDADSSMTKELTALLAHMRLLGYGWHSWRKVLYAT